MSFLQTAERVSDQDLSDNYVFQRSLLAYVEASKLVSGNVLEIGCGEGYGARILAPMVTSYTSIDKYEKPELKKEIPNFNFIQMVVPPFKGLEDNSFDFVVSFQVIEHIKNDHLFVKEIQRVLKPGGKFIVTTPNKPMSITRNPWHVREYSILELKQLLLIDFAKVETKGVFGNERIMEYYEQNKASVRKITRFDIFNLQYLLPRQLLQIPYDILNRMNRKKLLNENNSLVAGIKMEDYSLADAKEKCFDLFYIATK